ncbi:hypothetical protein OHB00_13225 [Streptomyces sp. NBC_00631]|uniref:hypothetical protein n=1 Tax=Streptomyces sp. NBC_00631 TaxID=2975793 RepID=UPI0030E2E6D5
MDTETLLDRFVSELSVLDPVAVWAHGSLAEGDDYQEGRSDLITLARATVTAREGRLISKREALDLLPGLGAPTEVVDDIRSRRYDAHPAAPTEEWTARRARLTRDYLGPAIDALTASYD